MFPLSNWTELDVWHYIAREGFALPSIYFAHDRQVVERDGMLYGVHEHLPPRAGETPVTARVRYRTVGDASCTAAVASDAADGGGGDRRGGRDPDHRTRRHPRG